ncbi:hypothetical protein BHYA_0221g00050 [Botrytis hyacinthi]|uniref:Uncharacterized protein n=1 Tax=Botrytis hyacinthi TaxID=278943 RepID=A0A4Z1GAT8_9HELO|nr:hypothetical protein BHYA_0221g00050 [Botrytis hyacinthi]
MYRLFPYPFVCSLAALAPLNDFPIGIALGIDYLTSAYITESDDFVTVAKRKRDIFGPGTERNVQQSNVLLHLDYQDSCPEVSIPDGGTTISLVGQKFKISDFGGVGQIASPEKLENLATRLKYFVRIALSDSQPPELKDFRRIIFSGDAPASEFQKIRETIIKVIPDFADRFSEGINPAWVSAVGAARKAREYVLNPPNWDYEFQEQVYGDESHDEL